MLLKAPIDADVTAAGVLRLEELLHALKGAATVVAGRTCICTRVWRRSWIWIPSPSSDVCALRSQALNTSEEIGPALRVRDACRCVVNRDDGRVPLARRAEGLPAEEQVPNVTLAAMDDGHAVAVVDTYV